MTGPDREEIDFPSSLNPLRGYNRQELDVKTPEHIEDKRSRFKREELELEAKLKQQAYDTSFTRIKEVVFIIVWIAVLAVILYSCFRIVINQSSSADDKKWATSAISAVITAVVTGIGSYLVSTKASK